LKKFNYELKDQISVGHWEIAVSHSERARRTVEIGLIGIVRPRRA
jgi:hypothetical protein